jgi:agmatine deiminase
MLSKVRIGLVQMSVGDDAAQNLTKALDMARAAAAQGAQVICLPELYRSRYFPREIDRDVSALAETIPGESTAAFAKLARELEAVVVLPLFEVQDGRYFNSACVLDADGSLLGTYRKIHIPHDPFFYERSYFEPGTLGYRVFDSRYLRFAVLICYDQWFPEAARAVALEGADAIFYPTAIGYLDGDPLPAEDWLSAWLTVQRGHAIANSVHVAAVNRTGREEEIDFWGNSFACDAFGRTLAQAGGEEGIVTATVDVALNERIREGWGFLNSRRPETYGAIASPVTKLAPDALGLSMPAEWEEHEATWLAWPHDRQTFAQLEAVEEAYVQIIEALHRHERVELLVTDGYMRERVSKLLSRRGINLNKVRMHEYDYADVWIRDYGPTFITDSAKSEIAMVNWLFNAWGEKYDELLKDGRIPDNIQKELGLRQFEPRIVLEGGSIDSNGAGTILTTEQCLLNPNRNPGLTREEVERYLGQYLGAEKVVWLDGGLIGDDTDGHIDNLARFVGPATVVCAVETDPEDEQYAALAGNLDRLRSATDQSGTPLEVVPMPVPDPVVCTSNGELRRLPASYLNFYIGNGVVLVPAFGTAKDKQALDILAQVFPGREVIGVDCTALLEGFGAIHCITQQQPATEPGRR